MSEVSKETNSTSPEERKHHLINGVAKRVMEGCMTVPTEVQDDMLSFTTAALTYVYDIASRQRMSERMPPHPDFETRVKMSMESRLLLKVARSTTLDSTAQRMLVQLSSAPRQVRLGEGEARHTVQHFPVRVDVQGMPVDVEVMRLEQLPNEMVKYIIHDTGVAARPDGG